MTECEEWWAVEETQGKARTSRKKGGVGDPTKAAVAVELEAMKGRRAELDADKAAKLKREDAMLVAYARARAGLDQAARNLADRERELAEQVAHARAQTAARRAELERDQARVVAELAGLGRTMEEIATMVSVSVKRARRMVKDGRTTSPQAVPEVAVGEVWAAAISGTAVD